MKRVFAKLKNRAGESIGETLVALLISSLALLMLAGAITSASRIITDSNRAMQTYYSEYDGSDAQWRAEIGNL